MSSAKRQRKGRVLNLLLEREIATQAELVALLHDEGFEATQASVSRDLDELGVTKQGGFYRPPGYTPPVGSANARPALQMIASGETLWVLRCAPGQAPSVALTLDRAALAGVAGTIAGDDTVFVALRAARFVKAVRAGIAEFFKVQEV